MSDLDTRLQRTERILEISRELTSTVSLERLLHQIMDAAVELTASEAAAILLLDEQSGELRFVIASGLADRLADIPVPIETSIAGASFSAGEPIIVSDVRVDPRHYPRVEQLTGFETRSLLAVPLQLKQQRIGVLEMVNKRGDAEFDQADVETLTALAAQATVAIENARLVEALQATRAELEGRVEKRTAELAATNTALQQQVVERERTEEELRTYRDHLEELVTERTAELQREIAERVRAEKALHATHQRLVDIVEFLPDATFVIDHESKVIAWNRAIEELTGVRQEDVIGEGDYAYAVPFYGACRPMLIDIVRAAAPDIEATYDYLERYDDVLYAEEFVPFLTEGEGAFLWSTASPLLDQEGCYYGAIQSIRNVTERARAQEELRRHHDQLEDLVRERTAELLMAVEQLEEEITERVRAQGSLQRRNQQLAALNEVTQALSASLELQDILDQALSRMVDALEFSGGLVSLADERTGDLVLMSHTGTPQALIEHLQAHGMSDTLCEYVYREGQSLHLEDLRQGAPLDTGMMLDVGLLSYTGAPITHQGRSLGNFCLVDTIPHPMPATGYMLLTAIGQQIGAAVENARLFGDILHERQAFQTLLDTAQALSTTLRLDRLLERVLDELQRVVPYDAVLIGMLHKELCWAVAFRGQGHVPAGRFHLSEFPLVQRVVRERGPVIVSDVDKRPDWSPAPTAPSQRGTAGQTRSWLGVPLIVKNEVIGVLTLDSHHPYTYGQEEARLAFAFTHQVALAIENSRLYEQVQAKLREATLLHSVTAALSFTLDLDRILPYVARSLCEILNGSSVELYSLDEKANAITRVANYVAPVDTKAEHHLELGQAYRLDELPTTAKSLAQRRPMQVRADDPEADPHLLARLKAHDAQAMLLLPMVAGDRVMGLAQVWESQVSRRFTEGEITTGQALIHQAAITIYNAQLVEALRRYTAELEAQNAELDAFAHTVAHDLKNPLASLIGYGSLLKKRVTKMPAEKLLNGLDIIVQSGHKMNTIIGELLLLASVRKAEDVEVEPLDMASIVAEAQKRLAGLIGEHQAEIVTLDVSAWPVALGRGPWIEEVWANYISNAIKYGGRPPYVELGATEQEDGSVRFWARDNGAGLTPQEQAQLFTPFTRLHQVRAKGHGLGLSIVQRIVTKLSGQVGVESPGVPGQGSTFFFTLPGS